MQSVAEMNSPAAFDYLTQNQDAFFHDISNQFAISEACRRYPRGTSTHHRSSSRVVKPVSTSNSPRAIGRGRRGTMNSETITARRQQSTVEQHDEHLRASAISARPLSWHSNSFFQPHQLIQQPQFVHPYPYTPEPYGGPKEAYFMQPHFSPNITSYSNETSPSSAFSSLPPSVHAPMSLINGAACDYGSQYINNSMRFAQSKQSPDAFCDVNASTNVVFYPRNDTWANYVNGGFNATTPPTPESVSHMANANPIVSSENQTTQVLDEEEEEGEILVGMGLYDMPEKQDEDPQLERYRSTVASLLGSALQSTEAAGKGLMLEQTWEPPTAPEGVESEGEEDEEDEEEEEQDE